jgi:hypothetical protein
MKLYVANTTKKNIHFSYRMPEKPKLFSAVLPMGAQLYVGGKDLTEAESDAIIDQLERKLGAVRVGTRPAGYVGVVYSLERPVKEEAIAEGVQHNDEVLEEEGAQLRQDAAIATHGGIAQAEGSNPADLARTTVSFEEVTKDGKEPSVDQTIEVVRDGESAAPRSRSARSIKPRK